MSPSLLPSAVASMKLQQPGISETVTALSHVSSIGQVDGKLGGGQKRKV